MHDAQKSPRRRAEVALAAVALIVAVLAYGATVWVAGSAVTSGARPERWTSAFAGAGAGVWLLAVLWERRSGRRLRVATAVLAGLALAAAALATAVPLARAATGEDVRAWNVFHYYVGSKYFAELGYTDLYEATLLADARWTASLRGGKKKRAAQAREDGFGHVTRLRDQTSGQIVPRAEALAAYDSSALSPERLAALGADTRFLRPHLSGSGWARVLRDLGYNPAPAWTVIGAPMARLIPARWPWFGLITNADSVLMAVAMLALLWAGGVRVAAGATLWLCTFEPLAERYAAGFLQYDWLASVILGAALFHRRRPAAAGVALSWGAMTRVFPGFLLLPFLIAGLRALVRREPLQAPHLRFVAAFGLSCVLLFAASHTTGRGLDTWPEWVSKITRHSTHQAVSSDRRVGVGRLAQHAPSSRAFWDERGGSAEERLVAAKPMKRALQLLGLLLLLPALWRRDDRDALPLGTFFGILAVVLSRYYAAAWVIVFLMAAPTRAGPEARPPTLPGALAGGGLLLIAAISRTAGTRPAQYFLLNWTIYLLFCALCVAFLAHDWRQARASRVR